VGRNYAVKIAHGDCLYAYRYIHLGLLVLCAVENAFKGVALTCQPVLAQRFRMGRSLPLPPLHVTNDLYVCLTSGMMKFLNLTLRGFLYI